MLQFQPITLTDKAWIEPLVRMSGFRGSEYTFSNNFNYRAIYHIEVARMQDYYLLRAGKEKAQTGYFYPAGSGDVKPVVEALVADAEALGVPFVMRGVEKESVAVLETLFPGRFQITETRDSFDYLYESEKLITLSGKKLHAKRNFINRFKAEHEGDWSYEPITSENLAECWQMNNQWCRQMGCNKDPSLKEESCAVRSCFDHFYELGLLGGLLRVGGKVVAYSMGAPINHEVFDVHVEKAFSDVAGAYPMINQQFAAHNCANYKYINREDDVGDEGLRKAKLSYKPAILLEKYQVTLK
ncbi:DUF2156 domain-containing protein [Anaerotruncus rubiinfantis]|uniref:DUF2156 domain-containing protein n=1 Tax=Anaerotruncus rubiinfantis TaxID=1720200 RepID=UPI00189C1A65|nr:phosphatidylglycerol lysyltransferase domain-containing protein [Anaerotruncus rubiinfantis]